MSSILTKEIAMCGRCPFCGSRDLLCVDLAYDIGFHICCLGCEGSGPVGESVEDALERWDSRLLYAEVWNV